MSITRSLVLAFLLLTISAQAQIQNGGGADVHPEKISAYEAGFTQDFGGWVRLDAAYWGRNFRNVNDPNVFFNTTVIFPNSVAKASRAASTCGLTRPNARVGRVG